MSDVRRRDFITLLGGAAAAWPLAARAQQGGEKMRRIAVLVGYAEDDPEIKARLVGFRQGLERLALFEGRNIRIDVRFAPAGAQAQVLAKELLGLQPDVILAQGSASTVAFQRQSRTIPIVFVGVSEPTDLGFVASLARPGGNLTGLMLMETSIAGNGWRCSRRSRRAWRGPHSCSILGRASGLAKPADLPVQAPTKYETVLNLKTARALGLTVPPGLLVAADEVIE